jgi:phosphoribosyl 1,2-cyclic phosphodiesterase
MIECGIPYKEILKGLGFNLSNVVGALISHSHKDHSKAVGNLAKAGINIYSGAETLMAIKPKEGYYPTIIESEEQFKVGDFAVLPFNLQHDVPIIGFLIQHNDMGKLLFITDSYYSKYKFSRLNHIMIECNYSKEILQENIENGLNIAMAKRLIKSHFSLENVKEFLKTNDLSQCKDITLLHLSDGNSNAEQFKNEIERLTGIPTYVADKGLEIEI